MSSKKEKRSKVSKKTLKQTESVVNRKRKTLEITSIQMPNKLEVGLEDLSFREGLQVYGNATISGSALLEPSAYLNFGSKIGSDGYGFRDNDGTLQFRNEPPPGQNSNWINIGGGSGSPGGSDTQVQFNDGGAFGGDSGFTYNKDTDTATVTNLSSSLTNLSDGTSYLIAGSNVTITTGSNGSITITATGGGSITANSGSVSVSSVSTLAASDGFILNDEGSGRAALTASIGIAEDGDYTDGLYTDFTPSTRLGVAIDRFNEILKLLAPTPAPDLDDIDANVDGVDANLSFGVSGSVTG